MTAPRIGSLFTGYGGLTLATERVFGGTTVWTSDADPTAKPDTHGPDRILAARFPHAPNLGDITTMDWERVAEVAPVDILDGGFPCQDLSAAGARAGLVEGNRSGLWVQYLRAIRALRPKLVIIENVRGLLSAKTADSQEVERVGPGGGVRMERTHRAMGRVLRDLADLGFDAEWGVFRASDVGAPHRRERVFILATVQDADLAAVDQWRIAASGQAEGGRPRPDLGRRGGAPALLPTPESSDATGGRVASELGGVRPSGSKRAVTLGTALALLPAPDASASNNGEDVENWLARRERIKATGVNGNGMGHPLAMAVQLLPTPRAMMPAAVQPERWAKYAAAVARWEKVFGRPAPEPTVPGQRGGQRLNPVFVEWMQGLPEGWVTEVPGLSANAQLKALGNGVVPQQALAAINHLISR